MENKIAAMSAAEALKEWKFWERLRTNAKRDAKRFDTQIDQCATRLNLLLDSSGLQIDEIGNLKTPCVVQMPLSDFVAIAKWWEIRKQYCPKDWSKLQPSHALKNTLVSSNDFGGDQFEDGATQSRSGNAIMVDCLKCPQCGFSREA